MLNGSFCFDEQKNNIERIEFCSDNKHTTVILNIYKKVLCMNPSRTKFRLAKKNVDQIDI